MILKSVYVRFYQSFNYDYLRKSQGARARKKPWEFFDGKWYPHVRVKLDDHITTIVGENESGKSCLLRAIECAVTGKGVRYPDFCRHSLFFAVEEDHVHLPQFGCEWADVSTSEADALAAAWGLEGLSSPRFWLFFGKAGEAEIFLSDDETAKAHSVSGDALQEGLRILPTVFRLEANLALPETVPISYLAGPRGDGERHLGHPSRSEDALANAIRTQKHLFRDEATIGQSASSIASLVQPHLETNGTPSPRADELQLAHDLVRKIARIDEGALTRLQDELNRGNDAYSQSVVQKINYQLKRALNFRRFWAQDKAFELAVAARNRELVFVVRDRTNREYSFGERSSGLRYFLSYYIQYLAHEPRPDGHEILLMDEPDTYLSRQGQQDLLKIFDGFAFPVGGSRAPVQVVYVTHSPYLVDRNNAQCIRVLQKGKEDEGTRVVRDASQNHYEPLRSAFGPFVAESTFIGNCNIMVEGLSDQVLLAGAARYLRSKGVPESETLDLNTVTIVQAGGASEMPYLTFLARGRDRDRPLVLALLDSDTAGKGAARTLLKGVAVHQKRKPLLEKRHVLQIADVHAEAETPEDLVPTDLAAEALRLYLREYGGWDEEELAEITEEGILEHAGSKPIRTLEAVKRLADSLDNGVSIEKVGFARSVVAVLESNPELGGAVEFGDRMKVLLTKLNSMNRAAMRRRRVGVIEDRIRRRKDQFLDDYPDGAKKEDAVVLFEDLADVIDDSLEGRAVSSELRRLRTEFGLENGQVEPNVERYEEFRTELDSVQYAGLREAQSGEMEAQAVTRPTSEAGATEPEGEVEA